VKNHYKNKPRQQHDAFVLGMLYIVDLRMVKRSTGEKIKHKILMVGSEESDIEKKLKWAFDYSEYSEFSIKSIEKVREKIHIITTNITQEKEPIHAVAKSDEGSKVIPYQNKPVDSEPMKRFAIGITTTMTATDQNHALRKVAGALVNSTVDHSKGGAKLSEDSVVLIEEVGFSSGYAMPRDVSNEANTAQFVRG
jgi:hypothetical protein